MAVQNIANHMKSELFRNILSKKYFKLVLFSVVFVLTSLIYNYQDIIRYRPISMHQWRNCVSASIALNYYHEGEFFHPRTHNMQVDNLSSDITITEFPAIYYFIGMLYRVFGFHEYIYKLVNVLIGFTGLYFLFLLGLRNFRNYFYALIPPLIIFTSPIFVYYINNFIPDATSLSIVFIGLYFFYLYYEKSKTRDFLLAMFFFAFAGLIKTPALLLFFATIGIFGLEWIFRIRFREGQQIFRNKILAITGFVSVLALVVAWYAYAKIYTDEHGGVVSPVELRPIWILSAETIRLTLDAIQERLRNGNYLSQVLIYLSFGMFVFNLVFWRKHNRLLSWLVLLSFIGGLCYSLLFFRSFRQHDYYMMNNLIFIVLVLFNFTIFLKEHLPHVYNSVITKLIIGSLTLLMIINCNTFLQKKYYGGWFMDYAIKTYNHKYGEITPYLRSLGIERTDKVYCTFDPSINISLYLMDQKGFTDFYRKGQSFSKNYMTFLDKGLKYVIIGNYETIDVPPEDLGLQKIGEYNSVGIYRVPSSENTSIPAS